jgi:rubrerythrin
MNSSQFLLEATRVEFQAEELYSEMADAFFDTFFLRDTFRRLASEERQHAMRLGLLAREQVLLPWTPVTVERKFAELREMSRALAALRQQLALPSTRRDPYAMLRTLAELEERFTSSHAEEVAADADPRLRETFAAMARQDAEHVRLLARLKTRMAA